jgi:hypothetical protein
VLLDILDIDQSYCVPGRFISDATCYVNQENIPLAIVSLDLGFGKYFISSIKTLYTNVHSLLKINNSLTSPFQFRRGIALNHSYTN